jgi:xeroderma pigmentosum group C-complementing protein
MAGPRRTAPRSGVSDRATASLRSTTAKRPGSGRNALPDVYQQMLEEVGAGPSRRAPDAAEPPLKRPKRPGQKADAAEPARAKEPQQLGMEDRGSAVDSSDDDGDDDEDIEFEDVNIPVPVVQTRELDSEDDDDEDVQFEDVDLDMSGLDASPGDKQPQNLELNLTAHKTATTPKRTADRKKPLSRAERERRIEIHKMHLLSLMAHVARRNRWCNDERTQDTLSALLSDKMIKYLNPKSTLSQFGQTESLKNGLQQVTTVFKSKFRITERGMWRALWAERDAHLQDVHGAPLHATALVVSDCGLVPAPGRHGLYAG